MTLHVAAYPACRAHDLFWPLEDAPASLKRNPADEACWLSWDPAFGGKAVIRIARSGAGVLVTRKLWPARFGKTRSQSTRLTMRDWSQLEDAVVAANFWLVDQNDILNFGCDGATWLMAGRRVMITTLGAGIRTMRFMISAS